jgi:hypothetical protein
MTKRRGKADLRSWTVSYRELCSDLLNATRTVPSIMIQRRSLSNCNYKISRHGHQEHQPLYIILDYENLMQLVNLIAEYRSCTEKVTCLYICLYPWIFEKVRYEMISSSCNAHKALDMSRLRQSILCTSPWEKPELMPFVLLETNSFQLPSVGWNSINKNVYCNVIDFYIIRSIFWSKISLTNVPGICSRQFKRTVLQSSKCAL